MLFADGGGMQEGKTDCSPPRWGGGELPISHSDIELWSFW